MLQGPREPGSGSLGPAMPRLDRLKRQLVSEVVRENVETLHGLPPRSLRRPGSRLPRTALRGAGLVIAPSVLFVVISVIAIGQAERPAALARLAAAPESVAQPVQSLPAPQAMNPAAF